MKYMEYEKAFGRTRFANRIDPTLEYAYELVQGELRTAILGN